MKWMMKNSKGGEDAMLTFAFISFIIVSLCVLLSCVKTVAFKTLEIELTVPDTSLLLGYLTATFGGYVMRRNKESVQSVPPPTVTAPTTAITTTLSENKGEQ